MAMTLSEETTFLNGIAAGSDRVELEQIATSPGGRTVRLVRIGDPTPPDVGDHVPVLHVGAQHGEEVAGREALLQWIEHLADTTDTSETTFLADHGVFIVPTLNPDGISGDKRTNDNGVDLNRDYFALDEPETRGLSDVLGESQPVLIVDHHEASESANDGNDITFLANANPNTAALIDELGWDLVEDLRSRMGTDGWTHGVWSGDPDLPEALSQNSALRHAGGILVETTGLGANAQPEQDRIDQHYAVVEETLTFAVAFGGNNLLSTQAEAQENKANEGEDQSRPFTVNGTLLDPPPLAYEITSTQRQQSSFHRSVFNVSVSGPQSQFVRMGQGSQPVIPYLFDEDSSHSVVTGTRRFTLDEGAGEGDAAIPLPPATINRRVQWFAYRLPSGDRIATLPEVRTGGTLERLIGEPTTASVQIPIPRAGPAKRDLERVLQYTDPRWNTLIVAVVNDVPAWGGIVQDNRSGNLNNEGNIELSLVTPEGYYGVRYVKDHTFQQIDQNRIMSVLAQDAEGFFGVGNGIGIVHDIPNSGILRDREYLWSDFATCLDRMTELSEVEGGPEFTVDMDFAGTDDKSQIRMILRVRDMLGEQSSNPTAVFQTLGAGNARYELTHDCTEENYANIVVAYSSGEGEDQPRSLNQINDTAVQAGRPVVEHYFEPSDGITQITTLNEHARAELERIQDGVRTWRIASRLHREPLYGFHWRLGDSVQARVHSHRHPEGRTFVDRAIGVQFDFDGETQQPILLEGGN